MKGPKKGGKVTLLAVGDILPNREKPETALELCTDALQNYDIKFGQWETILSERGCTVSGGARAHPRTAEILKSAGFDVVSFASNHCLDWGPEAMLDTIENIRKEGTQVIGAGKDITEARKPVIIERKKTKIAFLGYNSILPHDYWADVGKPGCAPVRIKTHYEMLEPSQPGCPARIFTYPHKEDMEAMLEDIRNVKAQADILVLSLHWGLHFTRAKLATYQQEVGHAALDAGADIIIGTHSHILKGIEVYKGKVIFYSLCNFILDSNMRNWPNVSPEKKEIISAYHWVIEPEWAKTYPHPPESRKTFAVKCLISNKRIEKVSFLPAMINIKAQPYILPPKDKGFNEVVKYVEAITQEAGLNGRYKVEGDEVIVLT